MKFEFCEDCYFYGTEPAMCDDCDEGEQFESIDGDDDSYDSLSALSKSAPGCRKVIMIHPAGRQINAIDEDELELQYA